MFREMRRYKQALEPEKCRDILKNAKRAVLSVSGDEGYPYGVPVNFYYDEDEHVIYFHCAPEGHKLDAVRREPKVCFTTWDEGFQKENDWAYYVHSVICFGRAELVTDEERLYEKARKFGLKYYPTAEELDGVMQRSLSKMRLVAIQIEHMTGKLVHEK